MIAKRKPSEGQRARATMNEPTPLVHSSRRLLHAFRVVTPG